MVSNPPPLRNTTVNVNYSAIRTQTPGNYPKRNNLHLEHGESLRTRRRLIFAYKKTGHRVLYCTPRSPAQLSRQTIPRAGSSGKPCSIQLSVRRVSPSLKHAERFRGPPSLLLNGYRLSFPWVKATGAWIWALIEVTNECSYISTLIYALMSQTGTNLLWCPLYDAIIKFLSTSRSS